jgi:UDP-N-acetylglucosamine pyrophosphorylase
MIAPDTADRIRDKMRAAGVGEPTIRSFIAAANRVSEGDRGLLPESQIDPVTDLPLLANFKSTGSVPTDLLRQLVVVKLNGGLGTSMGLDRARSLLPVKNADTFLDFIARQVLSLRQRAGEAQVPAFYLMDSFNTQNDTLSHLQKYPALSAGEPLDFLQNMVPKLDAETLEPASWPPDPSLEWCPPGHGDIYSTLLGRGLLAHLLERGIRFLFVSNSDNLGGTVDFRLLEYFAETDADFLMEVAQRSPMDRKGGHVARRRSVGRLLLREIAQCPADDLDAFQDIETHRYFNTNNLWVRLDRLRDRLAASDGTLPLPTITNVKPVDPRLPGSPRVLQLETAMGAAIQTFEDARAMVVPRDRLVPVKTTSDLLVLRSDACRVTDDHRVVLDDRRRGQPPVVNLDSRFYSVLSSFEALFASGPPSLIACDALTVTGPVAFGPQVVLQGTVEIEHPGEDVATLESGVYRDARIRL